MIAQKRFLTDSGGERMTDPKARQELTKIPNMFSESLLAKS